MKYYVLIMNKKNQFIGRLAVASLEAANAKVREIKAMGLKAVVEAGEMK